MPIFHPGGGGSGSGTISSIGLAVPAQEFAVSGSPLTEDGTLTIARLGTNALGNVTGATTVDWDNGATVTATLTGNTTFTLSDPVDNTVYTMVITQDPATARTITWPAAVILAGGGTVPAPNKTLSSVTVYKLHYVAATAKYYTYVDKSGGGPLHRVYVTNTAAQSIADSTVTTLTWDTESYDDGPLHSTAANTGRLTSIEAGTYVIAGSVAFDANATGTRSVLINLNGATQIATSQVTAANSGRLNVAVTYKFTAGDYVELRVFQNSGGALNVTAAESNFNMAQVCP